MIELKCQYCGLVKEYSRVSYFHFHENYCDENPNKKSYKGHKHTEDAKRRISEARKKFLQEHPDEHPWKKSSKFKSRPCESLKQWLRNKNIDFEEEMLVVPGKNYSADIVFPKAMLIVEVNGNQHYDLDKMDLLPYYQKRHNEMEALGWEVLEVPYNQSYSEEFRTGLCRQLEAKLSSKQLFYAGSSPVSPKPYLRSLALIKKEKELKEKKRELEKQQLKEQGFKVDSLGRVLTWAPTENEWVKRKELILNCGIDITKFGWVGKVEKATGLSKRIIETTVLHFNLNVFKRKCNKNDN